MRLLHVLPSVLLAVACDAVTAPVLDEPQKRASPQPRVELEPPPPPEPAQEDVFAALVAFAREHRALEPSTRTELEPLIASAIALASRASGANDLPRVRDSAGGSRILELVRDAALERVHGRIVLADGSVRIEHAEDSIVVASELAVVGTCRGCAILAGRSAFVNDVAPEGAGTRSLVWSAGALVVEDASGTVVAGPGAKDVATRRGVIRADEKILGITALAPSVAAPNLSFTRDVVEDGQAPSVRVRGASSAEHARVRVGQSVTSASDGAAWQLVQIFATYVALRHGDDVVVLSITE